jgi:hypothetical protein
VRPDCEPACYRGVACDSHAIISDYELADVLGIGCGRISVVRCKKIAGALAKVGEQKQFFATSMVVVFDSGSDRLGLKINIVKPGHATAL